MSILVYSPWIENCMYHFNTYYFILCIINSCFAMVAPFLTFATVLYIHLPTENHSSSQQTNSEINTYLLFFANIEKKTVCSISTNFTVLYNNHVRIHSSSRQTSSQFFTFLFAKKENNKFYCYGYL